MVLTLIALAAGGYGPFAQPPQCHRSRIVRALALGQMLDASLDATDLRRVSARREPGVAGF